jgi:hypothetical protein
MRRGQGRRRAAAASNRRAIIRIVISDKIFVHKLVLLSLFVYCTPGLAETFLVRFGKGGGTERPELTRPDYSSEPLLYASFLPG